jgi:hypothetical protein
MGMEIIERMTTEATWLITIEIAVTTTASTNETIAKLLLPLC